MRVYYNIYSISSLSSPRAIRSCIMYSVVELKYFRALKMSLEPFSTSRALLRMILSLQVTQCWVRTSVNMLNTSDGRTCKHLQRISSWTFPPGMEPSGWRSWDNPRWVYLEPSQPSLRTLSSIANLPCSTYLMKFCWTNRQRRKKSFPTRRCNVYSWASFSDFSTLTGCLSNIACSEIANSIHRHNPDVLNCPQKVLDNRSELQ